MQMRNASRAGATCAIAGAALLFLGTYLHPMGADPNESVAAFTEYAADPLWVASYLTQLAGVAAMVAAVLFLTEQLEARRRPCVARIAAGGAGKGDANLFLDRSSAIDVASLDAPTITHRARFKSFPIEQDESLLNVLRYNSVCNEKN
jgi:hypothetical protein